MDWIKNYKLILLSSSPRRKELMRSCGFEIETMVLNFDENYPDTLDKIEVAQYLSEHKMKYALSNNDFSNNEILITADTVVLDGNDILGKPKDLDDAKLLLNRLRGKAHWVITGVTIAAIKHQISFRSSSKVYFSKLEDEEIEYYASNYEVLDKAGAYGIQDWIGMCRISRIEGSYTNIMGLPTDMVYNKLKEFVDKLN